jgi:hypothetical protein
MARLLRAALVGGAVVSVWAISLSGGVAAASPDMTGKTYSDAQSALKQAGFTAVLSVAVGDKLAQGDCKVIHQHDMTPGIASWITSNTVNNVFVGGDQPTNFTGPGYGNQPTAGRVMLTLSCYGAKDSASGLATGTGDINTKKAH